MRINDEPVYRCRECLDQGLVITIHDRTMKAMRADPDYSGPLLTCGKRCNCSAGGRWKSVPFFDALRDVPCAYRPTEEDRQRLREATMQIHAGAAWTGEGHTYPGGEDF